MPKHSTEHDGDASETAKSLVNQVRNDMESVEEPAEPQKNPAAVALGRLGGKKGGPARAKKLSKKRRKEIAKKAARARWDQERNQRSGTSEGVSR